MTVDELAALDSLGEPADQKDSPWHISWRIMQKRFPVGNPLYKYISAGYPRKENWIRWRTSYRKRVRSVPPKSAIVKKKDIIIQTILILLRKTKAYEWYRWTQWKEIKAGNYFIRCYGFKTIDAGISD